MRKKSFCKNFYGFVNLKKIDHHNNNNNNNNNIIIIIIIIIIIASKVANPRILKAVLF